MKQKRFKKFEDLEDPEFYKKHNIKKRNVINVQMTDTSYASGFIYYYD